MTNESGSRPQPGAIALVGSGEYLDAMNTTDSYLLDTLGGAANARVVLLPTASGRETDGPAYWNDLGLRHFANLGVKDIRPSRIIDRASADEPEQLALLRDADFYYFSGGDPQQIIGSMRDMTAWEIITSAYHNGAVLAGCSAGAMAFGAYTISVRQVVQSGHSAWNPALGLVPQLVVFPHFDRMAGFISNIVFKGLLATLPAGHTIVGVDEDTALVRVEASVDGTEKGRWRVMGRQTVKVFEKDESVRTLHVGDEIVL
ncbi:MAG TPA: Type 1 glutamine amidotransferase-like domain-containing protein [Ktedonobacteraceae bacterium]|nr:Type 1 glutamine amidotransferase-like domain-containing protein [Ktedonobacteraceae bacterium]